MEMYKNQIIMVSIICNTFNQEKYIRKTIEGFINQKTTFAYEILIHDDASNDKTPQIIKEFEEKYPYIIKPVYQKDNKYSQGISITNNYQLPRAQGKYIAFCEGDDYWTNENKLQLQVEALENNPEINICAHAVSIIKEDKIRGGVRPFKKDTIATPQQVILNGGAFVGTCSIMYRKSIDDQMPVFRKKNSIDYTIQIHGALKGGLLYLDKNMGNYRIGSIGSWTNRVLRNPQKVIIHYEKMIKILEDINTDTKYKFTEVISFVINEYNFKKYYVLNDKKRLLKTAKRLRYINNREIYKMYDSITAIKVGIKYQFPFLYQYMHKK